MRTLSRQILWIDSVNPVLWERALIGYFWNLMFSYIWFGIFGFFCWILLYISGHYIYNLSNIEFGSPFARSTEPVPKNSNRWSLPDLILDLYFRQITVHNIKLPFPAFLFFQFIKLFLIFVMELEFYFLECLTVRMIQENWIRTAQAVLILIQIMSNRQRNQIRLQIRNEPRFLTRTKKKTVKVRNVEGL